MALVSVVVPVYNAGAYLHACVDSILKQDYADVEIILVNDGSTDISVEICNSYAATDSRVRVLHQQNQGQLFARLAGADAAQGEFITFVDADDWVEGQIYCQMVKMAQTTGADLVSCGYTSHWGSRKKSYIEPLISGKIDTQQALLASLGKNGFRGFVWNKLFKKDLWEKHSRGLADIRACEDLLLVFQLISNGAAVARCPQALYNYRQHGASLMHNFGEYRYDEIEARKCILRMAQNHGERVFELAKARYAEAAIDLLFYAKKSKDKERALWLKDEAKINFNHIYASCDIGLYEKVRAVLKFAFPRGSMFCAEKLFAMKMG